MIKSWFWSSYLVWLYGWWVFSLPLPGDGGGKIEVEERTGNLRGGDRGGRADKVEEQHEREGDGWEEDVERPEEVEGEEELGGVQGEALWVQKRQRSSWKRTKKE